MNLRPYGNVPAALAAAFLANASGIFEANAATPANVLGTFSAQAHAGAGPNVLLSGFIITGSGSKQVLVRGLGGSLPGAGTLADPVIEVRDQTGASTFNDNWKDAQRAAIEQTGHAPALDTESAILITLPPGHYTVLLRGKDNGTGVGKIDIIDVDSTTSALVGNMSARALVAGEDTLVAGFVINGPQSRKVIIRGIGPSLAAAFVEGELSNPTLRLRDSSGNALVFNDNWEDTQRDAIAEEGMGPSESRESAILATLAPGSYTAELIGACGGGGVALVEIYDFGAANAAGALPGSSATPTCFVTWAAERELTGAAAARTADIDGDGLPNFLEYTLGKNPKAADGNATILGSVVVDGEKYLTLSFTVPTGNDAPDDVDYKLERATSLAPANWSSSWTDFVTVSVNPGPGALETVTVRSTRPIGSILREFLRLRVTSTAP